jgi:polyferredoxin
MLGARILADAIVVFHAAYVSFILFGMVAIVAGLALGQPWARNPWFRGVHLGMILIVVAEALCGIACPLTVWESRLRRAAGQESYPGDFLGYWAHRLIFFEAPPWVFTAIYIAFGMAVLLTFVLAPPRRRPRPAAADPAGPR